METLATQGLERLTMAVGDYDHVRDLSAGGGIPGVHLELVRLPVSEIFARFLKDRPWDITEMSLGVYANLLSRGDTTLIALPVFTSRMFRHSAIFVRRDGGIAEPRELSGKTVGFPDWAHTAGVYVRGWLQHEQAVDLASIEWVQAGVNAPGLRPHVPLSLPPGIAHRAEPAKCLNDMLVAGEIDAIISAHQPTGALGAGPLRCLIRPDPVPEAAYYRRTGVFPIMHVVAVKRSVLERLPTLAAELYRALVAAKDRSLARMDGQLVSSYPLPWIASCLENARRAFGADPWPYGVEANHATLSAFLAYAAEQGVTHRPVALEELFAPVGERG